MKRIHGSVPAHLAQRARELRVLEDALRECLPAECCNHCRVAGLFGDALVLVVDSPSWSARVRFHSSQIISHFRQRGKPGVARVRTRVGNVPTSGAGSRRCDPPLRMPPETARGFAALARDTDDPELRQALGRLAARAFSQEED